MNGFHTSRYTALSLYVGALALVWLLLASLLYLPHRHALQVSKPAFLPPAASHLIAKTHHAVTAPDPVKVVENSELTNSLNLHSFQQEYKYVFTGQVTCGGAPCHDAEIQVQVQTDKNPHIVESANILPDGTYEVTVLFKEFPYEAIDWKITANSTDSETKELRGRLILDDESNVTVEEPIRLL